MSSLPGSATRTIGIWPRRVISRFPTHSPIDLQTGTPRARTTKRMQPLEHNRLAGALAARFRRQAGKHGRQIPRHAAATLHSHSCATLAEARAVTKKRADADARVCGPMRAEQFSSTPVVSQAVVSTCVVAAIRDLRREFDFDIVSGSRYSPAPRSHGLSWPALNFQRQQFHSRPSGQIRN